MPGPLRIVMVSWEYPPVVVGGLGRHVDALSRALAAAGHDVLVVSRQPTGTDATTHPTLLETVQGVRVLRVAEDPLHLQFPRDLVAWTLAWQHAAVRAALPLLRGCDRSDHDASAPHSVRGGRPASDQWTPDVVHAHDWLAAHAGIALAEAADVPLVATVHATEAGRNGGRPTTPLQQQVHSVERWLARRADVLITCSTAMCHEVEALFGDSLAPGGGPTEAPVTVIPNGVAARDWTVDAGAAAAARARWAPDGAPLLVHWGRLEHEKGCHDLLDALPAIRRRHAGTRLLVVGTGTQRDALVERARALGDAVAFAGHLPDADLAAAVTAADAVVLPSRYEPFGIVALEAAAAGAPLVVARAGGLAEVVVDGETGVSFAPGDVAGLADAVGRVLDDPQAAAHRARRARARLATDFAWPDIAARTAAVLGTARRRPDVPRG